MQKGPLAVIGTCFVVIVAFAIWMYSLTKSGAVLIGMLLILVPFILFGIGVTKLANRPRFDYYEPEEQEEWKELPEPIEQQPVKQQLPPSKATPLSHGVAAQKSKL